MELLVEMPLAKHVFPTFLHEQVFGVNRFRALTGTAVASRTYV